MIMWIIFLNVNKKNQFQNITAVYFIQLSIEYVWLIFARIAHSYLAIHLTFVLNAINMIPKQKHNIVDGIVTNSWRVCLYRYACVCVESLYDYSFEVKRFIVIIISRLLFAGKTVWSVCIAYREFSERIGNSFDILNYNGISESKTN